MDPSRADKLDRIYRHVRLLPEPDVAAYLDEACADDPSLRPELEGLLSETRTSVHDEPTHVSPLESITEGTVLANRFQIRSFLGRGGMGEVYLAADRELGGDVALKTLKPSLLIAPRFLVRFRLNCRRNPARPFVSRYSRSPSSPSISVPSISRDFVLIARPPRSRSRRRPTASYCSSA